MSATSHGGHETRDSQYALVALATILAVTVGWWALALWPVAGNPEWLDRARIACFNTGPDGLPDVSGWMLLIGQPLGMFGFLVLVWPREVATGLARAAHAPSGKAALTLVVLVVLGGLTGASVRVVSAIAARAPRTDLPVVMTAEEHPRLDRKAPALDLVDQRGERVTLAALEGRPALVTFAFANCHDICPMVVEQASAARAAAWPGDDAALVVVTLDPWRDTPARLPALADRWSLDGAHDYVLGGSVEEVEAVLDAWNVLRTRDTATGQIAHPPLTYLLDGSGSIAFVTLSGGEVLRGLAERARRAPQGVTATGRTGR
jgi:protein SCO1/2